MREDLPRRTLDELLALYMLEPGLIDFYVEGRTDRVFLEYLIPGAHVIEIDAVDVPRSLLETVGLTPSARNRVIGLAAFLHERLPKNAGEKVRCIVDADMDRFLERETPQFRLLRLTDFCCIEAYYFDHKHLLKYRQIGLHDVGALGQTDLWREMQPSVIDFFLIRAALASREFSWSWISPTTCCKQSAGRITFDITEFVRRLANKNSARSEEAILLEEIARLREKVSGDSRHFVHGHDFIELLSWYIRPHVREKQLAHSEVVARMLACCYEMAEAFGHPLLQELSELVSKN